MSINRVKIAESAQKYIRKGQWDKAVREYQRLVEDDPNDVRSLLKVADLFVKCEQRPQALAAYRDVAYYYLRDGIYDKAVAVFNQALRLDDSDPVLHRDLGDAYHRLGRLKEAVRSMHHAQRLYRDLNDAPNQRDVLERMVRIDPEDIGLRIQLAERYAKDGLADQAVELLKYAAQRLEDEGRVDEFVQVAERIVYLEPGALELRRRVIRVHCDHQDYKRALKHLQVIFKELPRDVETLRLLSLSFERLGKPDRAVLVYRELGKVYQDQGDSTRAKMAYEKVLELQPNEPEATRMLEYLTRRGLEDSGSLPGLANTGSLGAGALRHATSPLNAQPAVHEVEILDDDLAGLFAPSGPQPALTPAAAAPRPAPVTPVTPQRAPVPEQPRREAARPSLDLVSFADEAMEDFGFDQIQRQPAAPQARPAPQPQRAQPTPKPLISAELLPLDEVELIPEIAPIEEDKEVKQSLTETRVFLKYGLHDKAIQALLGLVERFPHNIDVRLQLRDVYATRGDAMLAADQCFEMARLTRLAPHIASEHLRHASTMLGDDQLSRQVARELGLGGASPAPVADAGPSMFDALARLEAMPSVVEGGLIELTDGDEILEDFSEVEELDELSEVDDVKTGPIHTFDADDDLMLMMDSDELPEPTYADRPALAVKKEVFEELMEDNVDQMFDDLFRDVNSSGVRASAIGRDSLEDMSEVDELIARGLERETQRQQPGLVMEAAPSGRGLALGGMSSASMAHNPFGDRSLSQRFHHASIDQDPSRKLNASMPGIIAINTTMNTNYELGTAYLEMGLHREALDEFEQAMDDPDVTAQATFSMALCYYHLDQRDQTRDLLQRLLHDPHTSPEVRQRAQQLATRL